MKSQNVKLAVPLILALSLVFGGAMASGQSEMSVAGDIQWNGNSVATTIADMEFFVGVTRVDAEGARQYTELENLAVAYDVAGARYQIMGIPSDIDELYVSVLIDGPSLPYPYPGSYVGSGRLGRDDLGTDLDLHLTQRIHLTAPFDNSADPDWDSNGHDIVWPEDIPYTAGVEELISFEWDAVETAAQYEVQIDEVSGSGEKTSIFWAFLYGSSLDIHLPPSQEGNVYRFWLWAQDEEGTIIATLEIVGIPGLYHFTVGNGG